MGLMRGEITVKILEKLSEGVTATNALFITLLKSGYGASYSKLDKNFWRAIEEAESSRLPKNAQKVRLNFRSLLSKLQRDGLVEKRGDKLNITETGGSKLKKLLSLPRSRYNKEVDNSLKIVIFDIPEKERAKRYWLRVRLSELGFTMLQKSVWVGKVKVPEEFLDDLRKIKILGYLDIFAVTKTGSLENIA